MRITSGFKKLMPSIFSGAVGVSVFIYGSKGESLVYQLFGLAIFVVSMVVMQRTRRRIACDIEKK